MAPFSCPHPCPSVCPASRRPLVPRRIRWPGFVSRRLRVVSTVVSRRTRNLRAPPTLVADSAGEHREQPWRGLVTRTIQSTRPRRWVARQSLSPSRRRVPWPSVGHQARAHSSRMPRRPIVAAAADAIVYDRPLECVYLWCTCSSVTVVMSDLRREVRSMRVARAVCRVAAQMGGRLYMRLPAAVRDWGGPRGEQHHRQRHGKAFPIYTPRPCEGDVRFKRALAC